jgi:hypothetical protein
MEARPTWMASAVTPRNESVNTIVVVVVVVVVGATVVVVVGATVVVVVGATVVVVVGANVVVVVGANVVVVVVDATVVVGAAVVVVGVVDSPPPHPAASSRVPNSVARVVLRIEVRRIIGTSPEDKCASGMTPDVKTSAVRWR